MASKKCVKHFFKVIYLHSVHPLPPPPFQLGFKSPTKFSKQWDLTGSQFLEAGCQKREGDFFSEG